MQGIIFKGFFLLIAVSLLCIAYGYHFVMIGGFDYFRLKIFSLKVSGKTFSLDNSIPLSCSKNNCFNYMAYKKAYRCKIKKRLLGYYIFGGLWFIGLVTLIMLIASIASSYRAGVGIPAKVSIVQPSNNKLFIKQITNFR